MLQRAVGRNGGEYFHFFCIARQDHRCDLPYIRIDVLEEAVAQHIGDLPALSSDQLAHVRALVDQALTVDHTALENMRTLYTRRLRALKRKRSYLIDLAAEQQWPHQHLQARIDAVGQERSDLRAALAELQHHHDRDQRVYRAALNLLANLSVAYQSGGADVRGLLSRALLGRIYLDAHKITS